jgi:hypothetical protein
MILEFVSERNGDLPPAGLTGKVMQSYSIRREKTDPGFKITIC